MQVAEPLVGTWKAQLALGVQRIGEKSVLARRESEGPLVVQKPLYPEGPGVCHAIVVHPPGGIAGGDELHLEARTEAGAAALLTTPGAAKWYRSAGPWAKQRIVFDVEGTLEWLPRETIVFDGSLAELECEVRLAPQARYLGWELVCLGRTGSGERFARGKLRLKTLIRRDGVPLWVEHGEIEGGGRLLESKVGMGGYPVFGTLAATDVPIELLSECRKIVPASTLLPGLLLARYLGDSTEEAMAAFVALWKRLRPALLQRCAQEPRIWRT